VRAYYLLALLAGAEGRGLPVCTVAESMIGMKKHNDFPDPVPLVTTKLCFSFAFAIA
jgi:hypothetical protein